MSFCSDFIGHETRKNGNIADDGWQSKTFDRFECGFRRFSRAFTWDGKAVHAERKIRMEGGAWAILLLKEIVVMCAAKSSSSVEKLWSLFLECKNFLTIPVLYHYYYRLTLFTSINHSYRWKWIISRQAKNPTSISHTVSSVSAVHEQSLKWLQSFVIYCL